MRWPYRGQVQPLSLPIGEQNIKARYATYNFLSSRNILDDSLDTLCQLTEMRKTWMDDFARRRELKRLQEM